MCSSYSALSRDNDYIHTTIERPISQTTRLSKDRKFLTIVSRLLAFNSRHGTKELPHPDCVHVLRLERLYHVSRKSRYACFMPNRTIDSTNGTDQKRRSFEFSLFSRNVTRAYISRLADARALKINLFRTPACHVRLFSLIDGLLE